MNDFDGLLPPRRPTAPLPRRDGPRAIVAHARTRRRKKAAQLVSAGSVVSIAFAGFTALRPGPGTTGLVEAPPASRPPSVAAPAAGATTPPPHVDGVASPSPASSSLAPHRGGGTGGGQPPAATPPPSAATTPPTATPPVEDWRTYTPVRKELVADSGAECAVNQSGESPTTVVCVRAAAPAEVPEGQPADLVVELCAQVREQRISYASHQEAIVGVTPASATSQDVYRARERPNGTGPHELVIPAGRCMRYTFAWNGRDNGGDVLPPGDYEVYGLIPGVWTSAGSGERVAMRVTPRGA